MDAKKLKKYLEIRCHAMYSKGVTSIKEFEIAFQDVIEQAYPDKCWWEVTDCQIFMELLETRDPEAVIDSIIAQLKVTDAVEESLDSNNEYTDIIMLDDKNGNVYELSVTFHNLSAEQLEEIEENGECEDVYHYDIRQGYIIKQEYFKSCSVYDDATKEHKEISYDEYVAFARYKEVPSVLAGDKIEEKILVEDEVTYDEAKSAYENISEELMNASEAGEDEFEETLEEIKFGSDFESVDMYINNLAQKKVSEDLGEDIWFEASVQGDQGVVLILRQSNDSEVGRFDYGEYNELIYGDLGVSSFDEFVNSMVDFIFDSYKSSKKIDESFSKAAYDAQTMTMLELKLPEEVAKQKEELTQCKEYKDERVNQKPDAKLKELNKLELADKSVTGEQETNEGEIEINDNEVSPKEAAKEVNLKESVAADMMLKLRQQVDKLSDLYSADIKIRKDENKVYLSAELDYSELWDIAEILNPIIKEYDSEAYFDAEEQGLWVAYFHNLDLNETYDISLAKPHYNDLISAIEDGFISYKKVALACLAFMTDDQIAELCRLNDFNIGTDFEE